MLSRWWRQRREARARRRRSIPDDLWLETLNEHPFLKRRPLDDLLKLRDLCALFLDRKEFSGAGGLEVTDAMAVSVAAQACLPVLHLDLAAYDAFVGIVLQPGEVVARRKWVDDDGIHHEGDEPLTGEAMPGGPLMLAWSDVAASGDYAQQGYNVVVHEFVHVIDMLDGVADGVPPLPSRQARADWLATLEPAFHRLCDQVEAGTETVLDPYGATAIEEYFPVVSEAFFVAPWLLQPDEPEVYELLRRYFHQDPAKYIEDPRR